LEFYSASSLKEQSAGRQVAPLGHMILILSQPVFGNEGIHFLKEGLLQNKSLLRIGLQGTKVTCEGKSSVHSLDTVIQYNLSNPTHEGTREICRIVQDVGKLVFFYFKEILCFITIVGQTQYKRNPHSFRFGNKKP
jgi:hypothetical protein